MNNSYKLPTFLIVSNLPPKIDTGRDEKSIILSSGCMYALVYVVLDHSYAWNVLNDRACFWQNHLTSNPRWLTSCGDLTSFHLAMNIINHQPSTVESAHVYCPYPTIGLFMRMDLHEMSVSSIDLSCTAIRYSHWQPLSKEWTPLGSTLLTPQDE